MASGRTATGIHYPIGGIDEFNPAADMQALAESAALGAYPIGSIYMSINPTNPGEFFGGTWQAWGSGRVPVGFASGDADFGEVGRTGGVRTVTLTAQQIPGHTHPINHNHGTVTAGSAGAHTHTSAAHTHTMAHTHPINHGHTASTNSAGEHTHNAMQNTNINGNVISGGSGAGWSSSAAGVWQFGAGPLGNSGAHTHTVTVANHSGDSGGSSAANTGSTTPGATGSAGAHTHDVPIPNFTGTSGSTGGGQAHTNLQPYIVCHMWVRTA